MSNFNFLKTEWSEIFELVNEAEECVYSKPVFACLNNRKALEKMLIWMFKNDADLVLPYDTSLSSLIHEPTLRNIFDSALFPKMNLIKKLGNIAAHDIKKLTTQDAIHSTMELFHVMYYFYRTYSIEEPIIGLTFDLSLIPTKSPEQAELERLRKIIEVRENEIVSKEDLIKENQELLTKIQQIKSQNKNAQIASYNYNEADTRKYFIDVLLKEVGWDITMPDAIEYEVMGMPKTYDNSSGKGYVDYVLWGDDGKPLGLVEAKRTMKDAKIGREQAERYADCLEKKFGQRPIMFYSNGYEHYIWDDMNYPPRKVSGFYSKDDLERLISRRSTKKDLTCVEINKDIAGRPYQERVIKKVCETFQNKTRKTLLVMATGTGKTRVAISITDVLTRYNWAKRILFLADRTPLVVQAQRNFAKILPELNPVDITQSDNDGYNNRVVISTYQTMMNLIDAKKGDNKIFSAGHFDLIIVDEAHRSIYKRFGEIFNYFDALLLGLTATPRDDIDKDTYKVFELEKGVPTDYYDYDTAVKEGYLVPYENYVISTKFLQQGIKYAELSEEQKSEYEEKFYDDETDSIPEEINANALNKWLFNADTVDKILETLMVNGIKVQGGDKLGKTIIFAANENHAQFIAERFDKNYPEHNGKFARVITHKTQYAQGLIDDFSDAAKEPTIAISVDKLDTGIDVVEVVNLVFFKVVRSKTKFYQMIGRGTRLCKDLFGPNDDKKKFYIFDACGNFEYFSTNPPEASGGNQMSLSQKIFLSKLELAEKIKDDDEVLKLLSKKYKDDLHNTVISMNKDNFIVRRYLKNVEHYSNREIWDNLDDVDFINIKEGLSHLPTKNEDIEEVAKRFDLMIFNLQLALYAKEYKRVEYYRKKIIKIARQLELKSSIPMVNAKMETILEVQTDEFWENVTISELEELRIKLRDLIKFVDAEDKKIVYSNFEDENILTMPIDGNGDSNHIGIDLEQYNKKVTAYLLSHINELALYKLQHNKPLTTLDVEQLEKILFENSVIGSRENLKFLQKDVGLGEFIRSIIGLDENSIKEVFAEYLDNNKFNSTQIRFIEMIIDYLRKNGTMLNLGVLYEQPFIFINQNGIDGIFKSNDTDKIIELINSINENARMVE